MPRAAPIETSPFACDNQQASHNCGRSLEALVETAGCYHEHPSGRGVRVKVTDNMNPTIHITLNAESCRHLARDLLAAARWIEEGDP